MSDPFPNLQILSMESLLLQEQVDASHVDRIIERMLKDAVLRDPPVLKLTANGSLCYLVLEGADCIYALKKMQVPHILGQIVEASDQVLSRALRVNYPLSELMDESALTEKNHALQTWLRERYLCRSVRCYEEETIFFDE